MKTKKYNLSNKDTTKMGEFPKYFFKLFRKLSICIKRFFYCFLN
jgi:hypothetical protein